MRTRFMTTHLLGIRRLQFWALMLITALGLHCGSPDPRGPDAQQFQLALSPSNPQLAQGTAQQFQLRGFSQDGRVRDLTRKGSWTVHSPSGETVPIHDSGLVEIQQPGRYHVTVDYEGQKVETDLNITAATLSTLSISPSLPKVPKGLTQQFKVMATFSDGTTQDVTTMSAWSVKDTLGTGVAIVNSLGLATAKSVGKARISARYLTKTTSTTLEVTAPSTTAW